MASLSSELTIRFDPADRALLERVAEALERANPEPPCDGCIDDHQAHTCGYSWDPERGTGHPAPPPDDEDDQDDDEPTLSPSEALAEIAKYLGVEADAASVVQGVKDLGSDCQDLRQAGAATTVHLATTPFRARCGADVPGQRTVDQASPMVLRGGETPVCGVCVSLALVEFLR
jgi:hypothetical protein